MVISMGIMEFFFGYSYVKRISRKVKQAENLKHKEKIKTDEIKDLLQFFNEYLQTPKFDMPVGKYSKVEIKKIVDSLYAVLLICEDQKYVPDEVKFLLEDINPTKNF